MRLPVAVPSPCRSRRPLRGRRAGRPPIGRQWRAASSTAPRATAAAAQAPVLCILHLPTVEIVRCAVRTARRGAASGAPPSRGSTVESGFLVHGPVVEALAGSVEGPCLETLSGRRHHAARESLLTPPRCAT